jgi:hypothetical protein
LIGKKKINTNNGVLQSIVDKVKGGVQDLSQKMKDAMPSGGNREGLSGPKRTDEEGYWFDTPSSTGDVTDKAKQMASKSRTLDGEETESLQVKFLYTILFIFILEKLFYFYLFLNFQKTDSFYEGNFIELLKFSKTKWK